MGHPCRRVRVMGKLHGVSNGPVLTVDTATDVPLYPVLIHNAIQSSNIGLYLIFPGPVWAFRKANGLPMEILGCISFDFTLGELTQPIECIIVPSLGPDTILFNSTILSASRALLDWDSKTLTYKEHSSCILSMTHRSHCRFTQTYCRIDLIDNATPIEVYVHARTHSPTRSDLLVHVIFHRASTSRRAYFT